MGSENNNNRAKSQNHKITKSQNHKITKSQNHKITTNYAGGSDVLCFIPTHSNFGFSKAAVANALLIAAAPEMLAILERLVMYYGSNIPEGHAEAKIDCAKEVIAKAKGSSHD